MEIYIGIGVAVIIVGAIIWWLVADSKYKKELKITKEYSPLYKEIQKLNADNNFYSIVSELKCCAFRNADVDGKLFKIFGAC